MSKLRSIDTCIWSDPWFENLKPQEKLLFIYLITNEKTNMLGVYEASDRKISFETGIALEQVNDILTYFIDKKKVKREGDFLIMINFLKHQRFNTNMKKSAIDVYNNLPEVLKIAGNQLSKVNFKKDWETLCKAYGNHKQTLPKVEDEVEDEVEIEDEIELNASQQKKFNDFDKDSYFSVDELAEIYVNDEELMGLVSKNTGKSVEILKSSMPDFVEKLKTENRSTETSGEFAKYFRNIHKGNFEIKSTPPPPVGSKDYAWKWKGQPKKYGTKEQYEVDKKNFDYSGFGFKTLKSPEHV